MHKHVKRPVGRNEKGYVLVMSLVVVAMVSITGLIVSDKVAAMLSQNRAMRVNGSVEALRSRILTGIASDVAWKTNTAKDNSCMAEGNDCDPSTVEQTFDLLDLAGSKIVKTSTSTAGFTDRGEPCDTFTASGNDTCPIRVTLTWVPKECVGGKCLVQVTGKFTFAAIQNINVRRLNPNRFNFTTIRGREAGSVAETCVSFGGILDEASGLCALPAWSQTCPNGSFLVQAASRSAPTCLPVFGTGTTCPAGAAAMGIKADGSLDCRSVLDWGT